MRDVEALGEGLSKAQLALFRTWGRPITRAVNLSVNGLAYHGAYAIPEGAEVDLRVRLPGDEAEYEAVGRVVRCFETTLEDDPDGGVEDPITAFMHAVQITDIPEEMHLAFTRYTLDRQEEVLQGMEKA